MVDEERCEALRQALREARARQTPPQRDTTIPGLQASYPLQPENITPDASPELKEQISRIEQELRNAGCEPE